MIDTKQLLRELIALPSVNPAFLPGGEPRFLGEKRVADFLAAKAARAGLEVELQRVFPERFNLLARLAPRGRTRQRLLLAPHLDTVGAETVTDSLFLPREARGRVFGRGACDTKGSVAAMFSALYRFALIGPRPAQTEIVFAGLVDEEDQQSGSRALVAKGFRADLAIVGEPTRLEVVTAHKGDLWLTLEARGKAAHGARPELGRNAVHLMARIVDLLLTQYATNLRRRRHPLLGCATVNVGSIAGGTQPNVVPARCVISVDRRTLPGEEDAAVVREIRSLLQSRGLRARLTSAKAAPCLPMETRLELPLVQQFCRAVGQRRPGGVDFFCDASILSHGRTPSIVFGPGDIAQAHTADEWISVASLERATQLLLGFLRSLP